MPGFRYDGLPGKLRRDHAGAQRSHASEEGVAPSRAALLGVVGHELGALSPNSVDVGRFANHQTLMVDARLHPADVVSHDEQDVGLVRLCLRRCRARRDERGGGHRCKHHGSADSFFLSLPNQGVFVCASTL